jgi:hypothetical protein
MSDEAIDYLLSNVNFELSLLTLGNNSVSQSCTQLFIYFIG